MYLHACMLSCFHPVQLFVTVWAIAHQAPPTMGFSRQEYWTGLPYTPPRDLPNPMDGTHICIAGGFFTAEPWGKPILEQDR